MPVRFGCALLALLLLAGPVLAGGTAINVDSRGVAIDGYDTVAFFTPQGATRGKPEFQAEWNGAVWYFASAENRDAFLAEPGRYAPQYGGWCAYALSEGEYASDTEPREAYTVVEGRLYLNWSRQVKRLWERSAAERIGVADGNWPAVERQLHDGTAEVKLLPED